MKLQNYEMEKYLKLNEELLDDETNPNLIDVIMDITNQLKKIIEDYKKIAKAKGMKYNVEGVKKEYAREKERRKRSREQSRERGSTQQTMNSKNTRKADRYVSGAPSSLKASEALSRSSSKEDVQLKTMDPR